MEEERSLDSEDKDEIQKIKDKRDETRETAEPEKGRVDLVNKRLQSKINMMRMWICFCLNLATG